MAARRSFRPYKDLTIPANSTITINVHGRYITCIAADADFEIGLDEGVRFEFFAGAELDLDAVSGDFHQVDLINDTGAPIDVTLLIGFGQFRDRRFAFSGTMTTQETKAATLVTIADVALVAVTATQIVAANTARRELFVANLTGAVIRVGDANVAAARGYEIAAGGSIIMNTSAAVYGFSTPGGNVAVTEARD